jgi:hypothetical protein
MPCAEYERLETEWSSTLRRLTEQKAVNRKFSIKNTNAAREGIQDLKKRHQEASDRLSSHRQSCPTCRKATGLE